MSEVFTTVPRRDNSVRSIRYAEDPGLDNFYDGAVGFYTMARAQTTTMKKYHASMKSKVARIEPLRVSDAPGLIYDPKTTWITGRRHDLIANSPFTRSLSTVHVKAPERTSPEFDKKLSRFETYARPNKRPTKMEPIDYFSLSRRDGNMYRFGSQFQ